MQLPRGFEVAGFVVLDVIGRGGTAVVYAAWDGTRRRLVALKVAALGGAHDARTLERFALEARAAQAVKHPSVVELVATGTVRGAPYLVLEHVPGGSLAQRLASGALPWREAARIGAGIARGLAAVHALGLVHRDVKPANVLLDGRGAPKLCDFGVVRTFDASGIKASYLTDAGESLGTFEYLAPEQADGTGREDARADLYGLGATLFALCAG